MKALIEYIDEGVLGDVDDILQQGDDEVAREHIIAQLTNPNLYYINRHTQFDKVFNIYKKRGKWIVDVNGFITCFCTEDGYITDGTYEFGTVSGPFSVTNNDDVCEDKCRCKSLQYGPTMCKSDWTIENCPDLKDLKHCPKMVHGTASVTNTGIETVKYFPTYCEVAQFIGNDNLTTLKGAKRCTVARQIYFMCNGADITTDMIRNMPWQCNGADNGKIYNAIIGDDNHIAMNYKLLNNK